MPLAVNRRATVVAAALTTALLLTASSLPAAPAKARFGWLHSGKPDLKSAQVLAFSPEGLLLVGDSAGSAVFAFDVGPGTPATAADVTVPNVDEKIAARLGTTVKDIMLNDMAVQPGSRDVFFAVSRGRAANTDTPVLVRVSKGGAIDVIDTAATPFAKVGLPHAMSVPDATGENGRNWTISDMAVVGNELFVAGLSNEEFSSTMRRIPLPFDGKVASTGLRLYHDKHSKYETQAPATAILPYVVNGKRYMIASYGCTPIVLFPIDDLKDGAKVTGKTIAELGAGQNVRDLISYDYEGQRYLVVSNRKRSIQILDANDLSAAKGIDESFQHPKTPPGPLSAFNYWGVPFALVATTGVLHLADFDGNNTLVAQRDIETGALNLRPLRKPFIFM